MDGWASVGADDVLVFMRVLMRARQERMKKLTSPRDLFLFFEKSA